MVCCSCVELRWHFKMMIFLICSQPQGKWGTHLPSFSTFPICFKCWMTIEWSTLSSSETSWVAGRGSASMILSICCCELPTAEHCTPHCQGSCFLCKTSWITSSWASAFKLHYSDQFTQKYYKIIFSFYPILINMVKKFSLGLFFLFFAFKKIQINFNSNNKEKTCFSKYFMLLLTFYT